MVATPTGFSTKPTTVKTISQKKAKDNYEPSSVPQYEDLLQVLHASLEGLPDCTPLINQLIKQVEAERKEKRERDAQTIEVSAKNTTIH